MTTNKLLPKFISHLKKDSKYFIKCDVPEDFKILTEYLETIEKQFTLAVSEVCMSFPAFFQISSNTLVHKRFENQIDSTDIVLEIDDILLPKPLSDLLKCGVREKQLYYLIGYNPKLSFPYICIEQEDLKSYINGDYYYENLFYFSQVKKVEAKKMTLEEISEALGYAVEIVTK